MANGRDRFQFDEAALAQIENIRRIGLRRLHNKNEIDDFVQETLLRAFSKRSQLRSEAKFEAWIAAIARNLAREWNRAYHRRKRAEASGKTTEAVDSRNPLDALEKAEERELLKRAMARLNDSDREILRARYLDDASYAELQERYGLSYSAVGQRLHRAKRRLRKIYMSIAAAFALFFGNFKHMAWGGMALMNKTAATAAAIGVLGGALVGGFFWMRSEGAFWTQKEGGAPMERVEKIASTDSTLTAQTTDDQETLDGANRSASSDSKPEHSKRSREMSDHETPAEEDGAEDEEDPRIDHYYTAPDGRRYGVFRPEMLVPDENDPTIYRAFWADAAQELKDYQLTWDKSRDHSAALETLRALAEKHGNGDADWTEYLYLEASETLGMAQDRGLEPYVTQLELKSKLLGLDSEESSQLTQYHLQEKYNGEDRDAISDLLEPIKEFQDWMEMTIPSEKESFFETYYGIAENLRVERQFPFAINERLTHENYPTVEDRVNLSYTAFFEALSQLPEESRVFTEYFDESFVPPAPGAAAPPPMQAAEAPQPAPRKEAAPTASDDPASSPSPPPDASPPSASPEEVAAFEAAVRDSIRRYGPKEALQRLIKSNPEWVERIMRSYERRQGGTPPSEESQP